MSIETLTARPIPTYDIEGEVIPICYQYIQPNSGGWDAIYNEQIVNYATVWTEYAIDNPNQQYIIWGRSAQFTGMAFQFGREANVTYITEVWGVDPRHGYEDINKLRFNGYPELAEKLESMLQQINEDPDEPDIDDSSLSQLSTFFINHKGWPVPFIGPNMGTIHAQWGIYSNGVFIVGFRGTDFQLVVNADADHSGERVLISKRVDEREIIKVAEQHGPLRY